MKFTSPFSKKAKGFSRRRDRFNPHLYWRYLLGGALVLLIGAVVYFALFFIQTSHILDAPVTPLASENRSKIKRMQNDIKAIQVIPSSPQ
ncbi:MAG TPA: hypothetical protein VLB02_02365 [Candidatus Paceibacterota bacterium]|nr:hypothetical protein [Candidatus Paceibacterota bacterium]